MLTNVYRRYAVYYTPQLGLANLGAEWLGYDLQNGVPVDHPEDLADLDLAQITKMPRKYGFHATLKAPFRPVKSHDPDALLADLRDLAASLRPVSLAGGLRVAALEGFLALIPDQPNSALDDLAAACVTKLDHHRAELTDAEISRRNPGALTSIQSTHLMNWGYPYILDEFQFHLTLSGPLTADKMQILMPRTRRLFAPYLSDPFVIDALTLVGEGEDGQFRRIDRITLG